MRKLLCSPRREGNFPVLLYTDLLGVEFSHDFSCVKIKHVAEFPWACSHWSQCHPLETPSHLSTYSLEFASLTSNTPIVITKTRLTLQIGIGSVLLKKTGKSNKWRLFLSLPSLFNRLGEWLAGRMSWSLVLSGRGCMYRAISNFS